MKIALFVRSTYKNSGIGRVAINAAESLHRQRHKVIVISEGGDYLGEQLVLSYTTKNPFQIATNAIRIIKTIYTADSILAYDVKPTGFYAYCAALCLRKSLVLHCIGTYSLFTHNERWFKKALMKKVFKKASKIFILSRSVKAAIVKDYALEKIKSAPVLPPGVMTEFFYEVSAQPESIPSDVTSYIITVGEIKPRKAQDLSLEAYSLIAGQYPKLHYVFVGTIDGSKYFHDIQNQVERLGLKQRVHFLTGISDDELRKLYSHAEFFVMTPRTTSEFIEGFGIVYLEAALCGLTSIGTYGSGAEDAIVNNETGILCEDSAFSIAKNMRCLLDDPALCLELSTHASKRAQKYTWDEVVKNYI